jgi:hypothetical protein
VEAAIAREHASFVELAGWVAIPGLAERCELRVASEPSSLPSFSSAPCPGVAHCRMLSHLRLTSFERMGPLDVEPRTTGLVPADIEDAQAGFVLGFVDADGHVVSALRRAEHGEVRDCPITSVALTDARVYLAVRLPGRDVSRILTGDPHDLAHTLHDLGVDAPRSIMELTATDAQLTFFAGDDATLARIVLGRTPLVVEDLHYADVGDSSIAAASGETVWLLATNGEPHTRAMIGAGPARVVDALAHAHGLASDGHDLLWEDWPDAGMPTALTLAPLATALDAIAPRVIARYALPRGAVVAHGHVVFVDENGALVVQSSRGGHASPRARPGAYGYGMVAWVGPRSFAITMEAGHHMREPGDPPSQVSYAVAIVDFDE